jgi:hypothetical protein
MSRRYRIASFGLAAALVIAGVVSALLIHGGTGQILALVLIGIGLVLATSLVFLEVGLSEDRERARGPKPEWRNRADRARRGPRTKMKRSRGHRDRLP